MATSSAATITSTEAQISQLGLELSSGQAVTKPSDDPSAAVVIQTLRQQLSDNTQYATNVTAATNQLSDADTTLGSLTTLLTQAVSTASANVSSTEGRHRPRSAAADTVDSIYNQVASTANTSYDGSRTCSAARTANSAPYVGHPVRVPVQRIGVKTLSAQTDTFATLNYQVTGAAVFGGLSASFSTGTWTWPPPWPPPTASPTWPGRATTA